MNKQQTLEIAAKIAMQNAIYGVTMSNEAVLYQAQLLSDLDFEAVAGAFDRHAKESKTGRPPTVAHIREIVTPVITERDAANDLARRLDKLVGKYGYMWAQGTFRGSEGITDADRKFEGKGGQLYPTFREAVISEVGEVGWEVISRRGGWIAFHKSANEMEEGIFIAQARDHIESVIKIQKSGVDITQMALSGSPTAQKHLPEVMAKLLSVKSISEGEK